MLDTNSRHGSKASKNKRGCVTKMGILCVSVLGLASYLYFGCTLVAERNHRALPEGQSATFDFTTRKAYHVAKLKDRYDWLRKNGKEMNKESLQAELQCLLATGEITDLKSPESGKCIKDAIDLCGQLLGDRQRAILAAQKANKTPNFGVNLNYKQSEDIELRQSMVTLKENSTTEARESTIYQMVHFIIEEGIKDRNRVNAEIQKYKEIDDGSSDIGESDLIVDYYKASENTNRTNNEMSAHNNLKNSIKEDAFHVFRFYVRDWKKALEFYNDESSKNSTISIVRRQDRGQPMFGSTSGFQATGIYIANKPTQGTRKEYSQHRFIMKNGLLADGESRARLLPFTLTVDGGVFTLANEELYFTNAQKSGKWMRQSFRDFKKTEKDRQGVFNFDVKIYKLQHVI